MTRCAASRVLCRPPKRNAMRLNHGRAAWEDRLPIIRQCENLSNYANAL